MSSDLSIQAAVVVNADKAEAAFTRVGAKADAMAKTVATSADKAGKAVDKVGDGAEKGAEKFTRSEARIRSEIEKSTRALENLGKTASQRLELKIDTKGLDRAKFEPMLAELRKVEQATQQVESKIGGLGNASALAGRAMAAAFAGASVAGFLGKVVSVQREFDVLNSSLKTVTGSSAAAERELMWLKDFAKETPFGLAQATQGFVKMKALGLDPTRAALTSFGNTASAMGKDLNQMIEAVADASTGEFERLKEFGIKAKKEGDNVSLTFQGVTTTIGNSAAEITKYLEDIGNAEFGGAMAERAKTLDGTIAALGDTWDELFRTVSSNNVGSLIFDSVTLANGVLEDATTIIRAFGGASADAAKNTGALAASQGAVATFFETVAVLGAETLYVLKQTGDTLGGLAAGYKAFFSFDFDAVRAIGEDMKANGEAARKEIDATTARILNARKEAGISAATAGDFARLDRGSRVSAKRTVSTSASAATAKAVKEVVSEYDKLIKKLGDELPKAASDAEAAQMGYNKAQTEFLALAGSEAWAKFTNEQRASVAALFETKIASEQAGEAAKTLAKANLDAAASREKYLVSLATGIDKLKADIASQEEATARMGLTKEAIAELDAAKLEMLATDLELQAIKALDRNLDTQTYDALKQQAALYRDLGKAKKDGATKEMALDLEKANTDAAKKAQDEWQRASDSINSSLTDSLLRGFESGKDFAKNLRDTVVNMFKTLVLRPIISAVVNPVAGAITGALGLAGTASAGTSALSAVGSGASFLGNAAGLLGGAGTAAGYGFSALMAGNGLGALSGGLGMLTSGGPAAIMAQGAGMIAGVLGPIALGIGALTAIISKTKGETRTGGQFGVAFDGSVTNQRRDQTYTFQGQQFDRDFSNGARNALMDGQAYRLEGDPVAQESAIRDAVAGTAKGIDAFLQALGSTARLAGFSAGLETSGKGRGGVFSGGRFADGTAFGESGKGDNYEGTLFEKFSSTSPDFKQALSDFTLDLKQSTIQALQTVSDIPKSVQAMLANVDAEGLTDEAANALLESINAQIVGVEQLKAAFDGMGLDTLAGISFDAAAGLAEVSGGFDKLLGNLDAYYSNFFSADEQRANIERQLAEAFEGLSLTLPDIDATDARAQFRSIVEGAQGDMSETGQKVYATLLSLAGAFASVTQEAGSVVGAVESIGDAISEAMKRLQSDSASLQIDLLRAQGNAMGADAAQRTLDTTGLSDAEIAIYDYNQSLRAQIGALNDAAQAAADQAAIRADFERQLLQLQGDTAALRLLDIAGMDAANVALYDRIQALSASQAAEQAAAQAAQAAAQAALQAEQELAAKREQVAQQAYGIETQLLQLQGNTAALRARELAALDPANRADQLRVYALTDALAATQAAADAERDLAATRVQSAQDAYQAAQAASGSAMDALGRSVSAERAIYESTRAAAADAAQEIKSVIDTLSGSIKDLYAGVDSTRQASATEGASFITAALRAARSTGYLPDAAGLSDAVTAARGGLGAQNFATQFEADRAQLVIAGELSEIADIAKPQLTAAERTLRNAENQLKTLDDILKNAQAQADSVRGISTTVGSIPAALAALQAALAVEAQAKAVAQTVTPPPAAVTPPTPASGLSGPYAALVESALKSAAYTTDDRLVYDTARMFNVTSSELDKLMGWTAGTSLDWAKKNKLPEFAVGTNYVPQDMAAIVHKGEMIVPAAYNPAAGGMGGQASAKLEALVSQLIDDNRRQAGEIIRLNNKMTKVLEQWNGDGMPTTREEVAV